MKIGILQPSYLPWLGYFEQLEQSDVFVLYDDVQYDRGGWRNRNRIKTANGAQWLTVPVLLKFEEHPLNREVRIDNSSPWKRKHLQAVRQNYAKAPFYQDSIPLFEEAYSRDWEYLIDLNAFFIHGLAGCLGLGEKKIVRSSTLNIQGDRIGRLIAICRLFKADIFYEGAAGKNYMDEKAFADQGIKVEFQDYQHPVYRQLYGDFIPYLSVVDLIFNHGRESLSILTQPRFEERQK